MRLGSHGDITANTRKNNNGMQNKKDTDTEDFFQPQLGEVEANSSIYSLIYGVA